MREHQAVYDWAEDRDNDDSHYAPADEENHECG